jgi:hypothetical protein
MRASMSIVRFALLGALIAACSHGTAPGWEFQAARARWHQQAPSAYTITLFRSCECTAEMTGPVLVTVRDGEVVSRIYTRTGQAVPPGFVVAFPSVDGLFAIIDDAHARHAAQVNVEYDPAFGFPTTISIDYDRVMADDEIGYFATDFHPL